MHHHVGALRRAIRKEALRSAAFDWGVADAIGDIGGLCRLHKREPRAESRDCTNRLRGEARRLVSLHNDFDRFRQPDRGQWRLARDRHGPVSCGRDGHGDSRSWMARRVDPCEPSRAVHRTAGTISGVHSRLYEGQWTPAGSGRHAAVLCSYRACRSPDGAQPGALGTASPHAGTSPQPRILVAPDDLPTLR